MRARLLLSTLALLLSVSAPAGEPVKAEVGAGWGQEDRLPKLPVPFPGGVIALPDLTYATIPGYRPLKLDIYRKQGATGRPLLVYIHGGGWAMGNSRGLAAFANFPAVLADLAARGYAVAAVNYRLKSEATFPAQSQDVDAAIRWLRANAAAYGIDPARVGVFGDSAGGHLAAMAAVDCDRSASIDKGDCVQAAVPWYGIYDFTVTDKPRPPEDFKPIYDFLGCKDAADCVEEIKAVGPINYVDARTPPFLLLHGEQDAAVPVIQAKVMLDRLKAAGVSARMVVYPGVNHGWMAQDRELMRSTHVKALQDTVDFFDSILKP